MVVSTTIAPGPARLPPLQARPSPPTRWSAGRVVAAVAAVLLLVGGIGLATTGTVALIADRTMRSDGWVEMAADEVATSGYAVVLGDLVLDAGADADVPQALLGDLRVRVSPGAGGAAVFVGVARTSDVEDYLDGPSARGHRMQSVPGDGATSRRMPWFHGDRQPLSTPAAAGIWVESAQGTGQQELTWTPQAGRWSLVVMRADATRDVTADVQVAATVPWLEDAGPWALAVGFALLLAAGACVVVASRRRPGVV